MLQQDEPTDYVIASGIQHSVREFVEAAAAELDIEITWRGSDTDEEGIDASGRRIVAIDPRYYRPTEVDTLLGDAGEARRTLGWKPRTSFQALVREMALADLALAQADVQNSQVK